MRTTYDDWDLWEQEVLSDASRRPLALKAGIGFIAIAVLLAIVAPVALVFRAGDEPTAPVSPLSTTRARGVPTSIADRRRVRCRRFPPASSPQRRTADSL